MDTVVVAPDGAQILEKPTSTDHARQMLRILSGQSHSVVTGVSVMHRYGVELDLAAADKIANPAPSRLQSRISYRAPFLDPTREWHTDRFHVAARVSFVELSAAEIDAYVATGSRC